MITFNTLLNELELLYDLYYAKIVLTTPILPNSKMLLDMLFNDNKVIVEMLVKLLMQTHYKLLKHQSSDKLAQEQINLLRRKLQKCQDDYLDKIKKCNNVNIQVVEKSANVNDIKDNEHHAEQLGNQAHEELIKLERGSNINPADIISELARNIIAKNKELADCNDKSKKQLDELNAVSDFLIKFQRATLVAADRLLNKVDDANNNVNHLNSELRKCADENKTLVDKLQRHIDENKTLIEELQREYNYTKQLEGSLDDSNKGVNAAHAMIDKYAKTLADEVEIEDELVAENRELKSNIDKLKQQLEHDEKAVMSSDIDNGLKQKYRDIQMSLLKLVTESGINISKIKQMQNDIDLLRKKLAETDNKLTTSDNKLKQCNDSFDYLTQTTNKMLSDDHDENDKLANELHNEQLKFDTCDNERKKLRLEIDKLKRETATIQNNAVELARLTDKIKVEEAQLEQKTRYAMVQEIKIGKLQKKIQLANTEIQKQRTSTDKLDSKNKELKVEFKKQFDDLQKKENDLKIQNDANAMMTQKMESVSEKNKLCTDELQEMKNKNKDLELQLQNTISDANKKRDNIMSSMSVTRQLVSEKNKEIETMKLKIKDVENEISNIAKQKHDSEIEISKLKQQMSDGNNKMIELKKNHDYCEIELNKIRELLKKCNEETAVTGTLQRDISKINKNIVDYVGKIEGNYDWKNYLIAKIKDFGRDGNTTEQWFTDIIAKITDFLYRIQKRLDDCNSQLVSRNNEIDAYKNAERRSNDTNNKLKREHEELLAKYHKYETDIINNKQLIDENRSKIENLNRQLDECNKEIRKCSTELSKCKNENKDISQRSQQQATELRKMNGICESTLEKMRIENEQLKKELQRVTDENRKLNTRLITKKGGSYYYAKYLKYKRKYMNQNQ